MLSIGWLIFWKALIVTIWAAIAERWFAYRLKRQAEGLPLRYDRKRNVYTVSDWTEKVERRLRLARAILYGLVFCWWAVLAWFLLTGRKDLLAGYVQQALS